jgi:hypothetical protein
MYFKTLIAVALLLGYDPSQGIAGENWPQFRGLAAAGVADGANLPESWSATQKLIPARLCRINGIVSGHCGVAGINGVASLYLK